MYNVKSGQLTYLYTCSLNRYFPTEFRTKSNVSTEFLCRKRWRNEKVFSRRQSRRAAQGAATMRPQRPAVAGHPCPARSTARSGSSSPRPDKLIDGNTSLEGFFGFFRRFLCLSFIDKVSCALHSQGGFLMCVAFH